MTIWFVAAAVVLIVELFIGTVYLLVVSVALAAAGIMYGLSGHFSAAVLTAAIISALGIWLVHGRLKNRSAPQVLNDDLDIGQNVRILRHLHDNIYEVAYRGTHWQAQAERPQDTFQTASSAVITAKNGNLLIIRTLSQPLWNFCSVSPSYSSSSLLFLVSNPLSLYRSRKFMWSND